MRIDEILKTVILELATEYLDEVTDLHSLVAKAQSETIANDAVAFLQKKGIDARSKYPSVFSFHDPSEKETWGVYVKAADVKRAGKELETHNNGLTFDPYVKS